jgi:DNA-binding CsgD family transcriptional regulator
LLADLDVHRPLALGEVQRRAKQRRAGRETLQEALTAFESLGASIWADPRVPSWSVWRRARRIAGRKPSSGGLTATERRLAELGAEGCSSKQAAAALFVTPKTVETQLSRIYAKLGIHSRAELARRVAESKL